jgi:hypothetical protein
VTITYSAETCALLILRVSASVPTNFGLNVLSQACCLQSVVVLRVASGLFVTWTSICGMLELAIRQNHMSASALVTSPGTLLWAGYLGTCCCELCAGLFSVVVLLDTDVFPALCCVQTVMLFFTLLIVYLLRRRDQQAFLTLFAAHRLPEWVDRLIAVESTLHQNTLLVPKWSGAGSGQQTLVGVPDLETCRERRKLWAEQMKSATRAFVVAKRVVRQALFSM